MDVGVAYPAALLPGPTGAGSATVEATESIARIFMSGTATDRRDEGNAHSWAHIYGLSSTREHAHGEQLKG